MRFAKATLDKPIITGEAGIIAGNGQSGCESLQQRGRHGSQNIRPFAAGDSAFLVWSWILDPLGQCSYNTGPTDSSLMSVVESAS